MNKPYAILFQPIQLGPVVAPNRFYQVPHCNGFGHLAAREFDEKINRDETPFRIERVTI